MQRHARSLRARRVRWEGVLDHVAHPECGPDGGELAVDTAWFGRDDAAKVLVLLSGTHGVEGFCGSGIQIDWLRRGTTDAVSADQAILMIHAVNPYGFAWLRRVTEDNVDLNRNWIDFNDELPKNVMYGDIHNAISPARISGHALAEAEREIERFVMAHGRDALTQAVSGGQYTHPDGLFYGGSGPTWARVTLTSIYQKYLKDAAQVAILDVHTGLGPWGYCEHIVTLPSNSDEYRRARSWYGNSVVSIC